MKKRIIALWIALVCALTFFSGCELGSYVDNNKGSSIDSENPSKPSTPTDPDNPTDPGTPDVPVEDPQKSYTVSVYYNNRLYNPGKDTVTVVWRNDSKIVRKQLGDDGKASVGELEGNYSVYLEGLPDRYTYNPSVYKATENERQVDILLSEIRDVESGAGSGPYESYIVKYDGTYRAEILYEGQELFYQYNSSAKGVYTVESWVNAYEDAVNPYLQVYLGSFAYKWKGELIDDGGFSLIGGFTKNFVYKIKVDQSNVGAAYSFSITGYSKTGVYPVYVDFEIKYAGDYVDEYSDVRIVRAKEAKVKAANKKADETFIWADMGTKTFSMDDYRYNEDTGFYHRYSESLYGNDPYGFGVGYGPYLCCAIDKAIPSYTITTLYKANDVGPNHSNYLRLYKYWLEDEQKFVTMDYTDFIQKDYYAKCNNEYVCYVTEELKEFLQKFAENQGLYTDGSTPGSGTPEDQGYFAKSDAMWLFACGFYTK